MSEEFLAQVIKSYSNDAPQIVRSYLEQTLSLFLEQQEKISDSMRGTALPETRAEAAQENVGQWLGLQKQVLNSFQPSDQEAGRQATDQPDTGKTRETP